MNIDFNLPEGFLAIDLAPDPDRLRVLWEHATGALTDDELQSAAASFATMYVVLDELRSRQTVHISVGIHPYGDDSFSRALFTVSLRDSEIPDSSLALHAVRRVLDERPSMETVTDIDLWKSGPAILMDGEHTPDPSLPDVKLRQSRLIVPFPDGDSRLAVMDMATPDLRSGDDYRDLLILIGETLSFRETRQAAPEPPAPAAGPGLIASVLG
ncbi:hypothetical protein [Yinghuangia seranimata]|uniref:hypothetical protein n=1 Tax=Yinghuangia seranimata TaxID=408067 RepID=UPI00248C7222|nr:hypothetical protein [Yinghuangia seranimata]MDI2131458.1 hypothetical protein [Yinghuangia seranimata]